jgi:predicted ATPase
MVEGTGDLSQMPELLRVKASLLLTMQTPNLVEAESCLTQSLELSRRQGARAWELRTATDLAKLVADRGERDRAHGLLQPVFAQFTEGFDTVDLKAAERLLADLE